MTQALDPVHLGAERSGETAAPIALALKDAIDLLATAKTAIDQMTEMLQYFTRLGGSGPLRDYREVKANLLRSRALRSTANPKRIVPQKTPPTSASVQSAAKMAPSEPQKPRAARPNERPALIAE